MLATWGGGGGESDRPPGERKDNGWKRKNERKDERISAQPGISISQHSEGGGAKGS